MASNLNQKWVQSQDNLITLIILDTACGSTWSQSTHPKALWDCQALPIAPPEQRIESGASSNQGAALLNQTSNSGDIAYNPTQWEGTSESI